MDLNILANGKVISEKVKVKKPYQTELFTKEPSTKTLSEAKVSLLGPIRNLHMMDNGETTSSKEMVSSNMMMDAIMLANFIVIILMAKVP